MNDLTGISSLPGGAVHVIDAIVGVTTSNSAENRTLVEVIGELTAIMKPDLLTYLHSSIVPGEYKILRSRDEYFNFLQRFAQHATSADSSVQSVSGNETFFNSMVTISASWTNGEASTWQLCVVGRRNGEQLAELWLISSRSNGPSIDYSTDSLGH